MCLIAINRLWLYKQKVGLKKMFCENIGYIVRSSILEIIF